MIVGFFTEEFNAWGGAFTICPFRQCRLPGQPGRSHSFVLAVKKIPLPLHPEETFHGSCLITCALKYRAPTWGRPRDSIDVGTVTLTHHSGIALEVLLRRQDDSNIQHLHLNKRDACLNICASATKTEVCSSRSKASITDKIEDVKVPGIALRLAPVILIKWFGEH